jgi:hypothetical protein
VIFRLGVHEAAQRLAGLDHALRGALAHGLGVAIAPHIRRQDCLVTLVDVVADALPHQVGADRKAIQPLRRQHVPAAFHVVFVSQRLLDIEVVTPAGQLNPS